MATRKSRPNVKISVAIIGAIALIVAALFNQPLAAIIQKYFSSPTQQTTKIAVRIAEPTGASIPNAKVLIFSLEETIINFSDSNGVANFDLKSAQNSSARLIVETDKYEIYEQDIKVSNAQSIDVRLKKKAEVSNSTPSKVIFRAIDQQSSEPIQGVEITLVIKNEINRESTDSYGFATFEIDFRGENSVDIQIYISTKDYKSKTENITLLPDRVREIALNRIDNAISISEVNPAPGEEPTSTQSQPSISTEIITPTSPTPTVISVIEESVPSIERPSVRIESQVSEIVNLDTGFKVSTEASQLTNGNGELNIIVRTPANQPFTNFYVDVRKQKIDLNGQPIQGDRVYDFYTNDMGMGAIELPPGTYQIWPNFRGEPWNELYFNKEIEAGKITKVIIVPSQLSIIIRRADNSLIRSSYVDILFQKSDLNNQPLVGDRIFDGYTDDTGGITFNILPGTYVIRLDAARGEDWGMFNNELPPATHVTYNVTLGRIRIEARDDTGNAREGFWSEVKFQKRDVNNFIISGDRIAEGRTTDAGYNDFDLTPGKYYVNSEKGVLTEVEVKSGEVRVLKDTDFVKP